MSKDGFQSHALNEGTPALAGSDSAGSGSAASSPGGTNPPACEFDPPFDILEPAGHTSALVFSSPHSGAHYPESFLRASRLDALALRRSEDAYVDELFAGAMATGAPLIRARFPRAYLDVNREPYELDPRMFEGRLPSGSNTRSVRVAGGLGTIARVVGEAQEIYRERMPVAAGLQRIEDLYRPYHRALRALLERSWRQFGVALLVECHSMPSSAHLAQAYRESSRADEQYRDELYRADFVLGDRYGASCHPQITAWLQAELEALGYSVRLNKPYAGGYITETYGAPAMGVHAIQIEVNRALYMNEMTLEKHPGFISLTNHISALLNRFNNFIALQYVVPPAAAAE